MSKIVTTHVRPPIPMRSHDWSAHFDGREDGPVGWGSTESEAVSALEIERIFHMTDEECRLAGIDEYGSEEAWRAAMDRLRNRMLVTAGARPSEAPTPDPAVMRDYIVKLTAFFIDNPAWVALAEEARGYIGALKAEGLVAGAEQVRGFKAEPHPSLPTPTEQRRT